MIGKDTHHSINEDVFSLYQIYPLTKANFKLYFLPDLAPTVIETPLNSYSTDSGLVESDLWSQTILGSNPTSINY